MLLQLHAKNQNNSMNWFAMKLKKLVLGHFLFKNPSTKFFPKKPFKLVLSHFYLLLSAFCVHFGPKIIKQDLVKNQRIVWMCFTIVYFAACSIIHLKIDSFKFTWVVIICNNFFFIFIYPICFSGSNKNNNLCA